MVKTQTNLANAEDNGRGHELQKFNWPLKTEKKPSKIFFL